jgi:oxaloacetate decarboxylase (Na+ extruding) subunit gamma
MDLSIAELLVSGLKLMVIGMGIVFFFLVLLVAVIHQTHGIMARFERRAGRAARSSPVPTSRGKTSDAVTDQELVAVVSAAIHHYEQGSPQL